MAPKSQFVFTLSNRRHLGQHVTHHHHPGDNDDCISLPGHPTLPSHHSVTNSVILFLASNFALHQHSLAVISGKSVLFHSFIIRK